MSNELYLKKEIEQQDAKNQEQDERLDTVETYQTDAYTGSGSQTGSGYFRLDTADNNVEKEGSGLFNYTDDGTNGTRLTALVKCKMEVNFGCGGPSISRGFSIRRNNVTVSIGTSVVTTAADHGHASATIILLPGDWVSFFSSQSGFNNSRFHAFATKL